MCLYFRLHSQHTICVTRATVALNLALIDTSLFPGRNKEWRHIFRWFLRFRLYSADCCFPQSFFLSLAYYYKRRFMLLYIPRALSVRVCGRDLSPNTLFKRNSPLLLLSLHAPIRVVSCLLRSDKYAICCILVLWGKVGLIAAPCPSVSLSVCNWRSFVRSEELIVFCGSLTALRRVRRIAKSDH